MTQSNIKVAITGGIGSGKSTVAEIIAGCGYKVISCDEIYRQLINNKNFLKILVEQFGNILTPEGLLDRDKLSDMVFSDKDKLNKLNAITHPAIMEEAMKNLSGEGINFCEVPLLFEGGYENNFDKVIVVLRKKELRISAVSKRDKTNIEKVKDRINNQFNYDNDKFEKYYVIHNNGNLADLRTKTLEILKKISI